MGTYGISTDELIESFETWLRSFEGDVSAETVAEAWNQLGAQYGWDDRMTTTELSADEIHWLIEKLQKMEFDPDSEDGCRRESIWKKMALLFGEKRETMNLSEEIEVSPGAENICRGARACKNRKFDAKQSDCQECLDDASAAIEDSMKG